jgi:hypothetical protein
VFIETKYKNPNDFEYNFPKSDQLRDELPAFEEGKQFGKILRTCDRSDGKEKYHGVAFQPRFKLY